MWRPVVPLMVFGLSNRVTLTGILDTGSAETLLPVFLVEKIQPAFVAGESSLLQGPDGTLFPVKYGTVDLGIRLKRKTHRWYAKVGFQEGREEALLGHTGFLQFFAVTFNGPERFATLRPGRAFPRAIMPT
ncbi:MAG: hypothetical protein P4L84_03925 [Isosphaeraceae bacterium]|nr:hypothetical protein [Isosphaeraceae bacterium]